MRKQLLAGAVVVALAAGMTTGAMAFDHGGADGFHDSWFHRGGFHVHGRDFHAGYSGFRGTYARSRGSSFGDGRHHGWSTRRYVGGQNGRGYGPSQGTYYEGVAPFGRLVGPAPRGMSFFVGL